MLNRTLLLMIGSVFVAVLLSGCVMDEQESGEDLEFSSTESEISYNGHDYIFVNTPKTWLQAQAYCASYNTNTSGGASYHLVTIENSAEESFLNTQEIARGLNNWWIGYSDMWAEGTWVWSNSSLSTYANWAPGEPNDYATGGEDCALDRWNGTDSWNDYPCNLQNPFICERDYYANGTDGSFPYYMSPGYPVQQMVNLTAGQVFTVGTCGLPGATGIGNTLLQLFYPGSTLIDQNDNSGYAPPDCGSGLLSNFSVVIPTTATYQIKVSCLSSPSCSGTVVYNW